MSSNVFTERRLAAQARGRANAGKRRYHDQERAAALARLEADADAGRRAPAASRITCALDKGQHYGPQVDAALGVLADPPDVVDRWEAGTLVPTFAEVRRLAVMTGFLVEWFYRPELEPIGPVFICRR